MHLEPTDPGLDRAPAPLGEHVHDLVLLEAPTAQSPGHDRAEALHAEDPVHGEPGRAVSERRYRAGSGDFVEGCDQLVEPGALRGGGRDDRCALEVGPAQLLLHLEPCELGELVIDRVHLGESDHAALDPEQVTDGEVLAALRHHALVRRDSEQDQVDARGPRHHGAHQALVSRYVDDPEHPTRRERELRKAELDRDPALLLLGQAITVHTGQGLHERGLAVVDVTCAAEDQSALGAALRRGFVSHRSDRSPCRV